jgi:hypothetical protein
MLWGIDVGTLRELVTPPMPTPAWRAVAPVPDDPVQVELLRSTQVFCDVAAQILQRSVPGNTRDSYASHIRAWAEWCARRWVPALPADPVEVLYFLTAYGVEFDSGQAVCDAAGDPVQAHAAASLGVRAAALARIHRNAGLLSPTDDSAVKELLAGLRRMFGVRPCNAKGAIDLAMLQQLSGWRTGRCGGQDRCAR